MGVDHYEQRSWDIFLLLVNSVCKILKNNPLSDSEMRKLHKYFDLQDEEAINYWESWFEV
ncbi:hypothetical protein D3C78_932260 [compost metagenome]